MLMAIFSILKQNCIMYIIWDQCIPSSLKSKNMKGIRRRVETSSNTLPKLVVKQQLTMIKLILSIPTFYQ